MAKTIKKGCQKEMQEIQTKLAKVKKKQIIKRHFQSRKEKTDSIFQAHFNSLLIYPSAKISVGCKDISRPICVA